MKELIFSNMATKEMLLSADEISKSKLNTYLNEEEIKILLLSTKKCLFSPGEVILQQGTKIQGVYIVIEGNPVVAARVMSQGITDIETLGPGDFLGEMDFIDEEICSSSVIAKEYVECLFIPSLYFELLATYSPQTDYKILSTMIYRLSNRLKTMHAKILERIIGSEMTSFSFLTRMINSFTRPKITTFEKHGINKELLQKKWLFNRFTKEELNELFQHASILKAPKNCKLIDGGQKNSSCYIVIQGAIQSSIIKANKVAKLSVIGPGILFASLACVDKSFSFSVTFSTCEPAILLKISEKELNYLQQNKPILGYKLFYLIYKSVAALKKSIDKLDIRLNIETYN